MQHGPEAGSTASRAIRRLGLDRPSRAVVAIGAVFTIVVLLFVVLGGGKSGEPSGKLPSNSASAPESGAAGVGPQVPPVNACGLLTAPEQEEALGLTDLPFVDRSVLTLKLGEGCAWQNHRDGGTVEGLSLRIGPGSPDDLAPGASLDGVPGEKVDGVGDAAAWFGGPDAGTLSVAKASSLGYVFVRIILERADIGDAERQQVAAKVADGALYRLPGVEARELVTTIFEPDPPDTSDHGYVGNLLAREEAGEWTRAEGLVMTLRLLAGEADADEVLRHPDQQPVFSEATGTFAMAQLFLVTGTDESAKDSIIELLGRLVFSNEQLEAMAGIGAPSASPSETPASATSDIVLAAARSAPNAGQMLAQGAVDCTQFFYYFETSPGVGDCLEWEPVNIGPGLEDKYRIFIPAPSLPQAGWTRFHFQNARNALTRAAAVYEGLAGMPKVNVVFAVAQAGDALMAATNQGGGKPCGVFIYTSSQNLTVPQFQQSLAHELGHCFTAHNVTPQSRITYPVKKWWEEGVAEYLSNVVYDTVNYEWRWSESLADLELYASVVARDYENFAFFQHMANESSTQGVLTLLATLPGCGSASTDLQAEEWATCGSRGVREQAAVLAGYPDIVERYHAFAERMSDGSVTDTGGQKVPFKPQAFLIRDVGQFQFPMNAFEVIRPHLEVPEGLYACLNHEPAGHALVSWRTGKPDGLGLERDWNRNLPRTLRGEAVFAATAIGDGAVYTLEVKDFVEKQSDCGPDEDSQGPACDLLICGPSDFYKNPEQLEDWLLEVLPPLSLPR